MNLSCLLEYILMVCMTFVITFSVYFLFPSDSSPCSRRTPVPASFLFPAHLRCLGLLTLSLIRVPAPSTAFPWRPPFQYPQAVRGTSWVSCGLAGILAADTSSSESFCRWRRPAAPALARSACIGALGRCTPSLLVAITLTADFLHPAVAGRACSWRRLVRCGWPLEVACLLYFSEHFSLHFLRVALE